MAYPYDIGDIPISGRIGLTGLGDTYATHIDVLGQGGWQSIETVSDRDSIPAARRKFGMIVSVYLDGTPANNTRYILANVALGGADNVITNNANWIAYSSGTGDMLAATYDPNNVGADAFDYNNFINVPTLVSAFSNDAGYLTTVALTATRLGWGSAGGIMTSSPNMTWDDTSGAKTLRITSSASNVEGLLLVLGGINIINGTIIATRSSNAVMDLNSGSNNTDTIILTVNSLATNNGMSIRSSSSSTSTRSMYEARNTGTASVNVTGFHSYNAAPTSSNYYRQFKMTAHAAGDTVNTIWQGIGTKADGTLSGTTGDMIINGDGNSIEICVTGTTWFPVSASKGSTYTPGATNVTNITSSTPNNANYVRIGNQVFVSGTITVTNTLAVASEVDLALPIASDLSAATDLNGTATMDSTASVNMYIKGDATNNRASIFFTSAGVGQTSVIYYNYSYTII